MDLILQVMTFPCIEKHLWQTKSNVFKIQFLGRFFSVLHNQLAVICVTSSLKFPKCLKLWETSVLTIWSRECGQHTLALKKAAVSNRTWLLNECSIKYTLSHLSQNKQYPTRLYKDLKEKQKRIVWRKADATQIKQRH
jgi:hypothetical protein